MLAVEESVTGLRSKLQGHAELVSKLQGRIGLIAGLVQKLDGVRAVAGTVIADESPVSPAPGNAWSALFGTAKIALTTLVPESRVALAVLSAIAGGGGLGIGRWAFRKLVPSRSSRREASRSTYPQSQPVQNSTPPDVPRPHPRMARPTEDHCIESGVSDAEQFREAIGRGPLLGPDRS